MNVLVLAPHPFFQNRGTPIAVKLLVDVLAEHGHTVRILTYHEGEDVASVGWTLDRIPRIPGVRGIRPGFSFKKLICDAVLAFKCLSLVRKNRYDLIHAVEESAFIALAINKIFGVPYLYDMDSSLAQQMMEKFQSLRRVRPVLEWFERLVIRHSVGVVAVCKALEETVKAYDPNKDVLRLEDISLLGEEGTVDTVEALDAPRPVAMYVGNLESYQGIDLLLESFRIAQDAKAQGSLVVIGGADEDIAKYRAKTRDLSLEERVLFLGPKPVSDLGAWLRQADVLVSPRIQGHNTPMKIYSYLDSGKPLLATRLPTHTQVLDDEIACLTEPVPREFGRGLNRLFQDREYAAALAAKAKRRVEQEFTIQAFRRKLIDFYRVLEADASPDQRSSTR